MPIHAILHRAASWFVESGIQEPSGGVARYYRDDIRENRLISTEITGYAVSTLLYLLERTGRPDCRDAALRAGRYLVLDAWRPEWKAFPCDCSSGGPQPEPFAYFFDFGIIVRGLAALWRHTQERVFLETAVACGRSMLTLFATGEPGQSHPVVALPGGAPLPREPRWSRSAACYQLKSAMAWHDLHAITGEAEFRDAYNAALEFALATHEEFLPGTDHDFALMDRLHAYAYFLEGLLPRVPADPRCATVLAEGVARLAHHVQRLESRVLRADVVAQLLRLRLHAGALTGEPVDRLAADREAAALLTFAATGLDRRVHGGFWFGRRDGQRIPHVSPVPAAFAVQALALWQDLAEARAADPWPQLV